MLLRLLFPSWAFFDRVTDIPTLEIRRGSTEDGRAPWTSALSAPARSLRHVVYNPEGTAHLLLQSAVDRFAVDAEQGRIDPVTRDIVAAIAERAVAPGPSSRWQWRVVAAGDDVDTWHRVLYESVEQVGASASRQGAAS